MKITRLSWAGLMLESKTTTIYIDPLENVELMQSFLGAPKYPVLTVPKASTLTANALITHIHPDHFDQPLLAKLVGSKGMIYSTDSVKAAGIENNLSVNAVKLNETFMVGDFQVTAVPAVDWIGDEQVSYVISDGKHTIIHGGDTNWHGYWWPIAKQFGPFDLTFLPVNGVVGAVPGIEETAEMYGTMTPTQAITATRILGATKLVPMHYAQFENAPGYTQYPNLENALDEAAESQNITVKRLTDGEEIIL